MRVILIEAPSSAYRGGMPALGRTNVYPAAMPATRDLGQRRMYLMPKRAELLAHIQNTNSQYNLPELGKKLASKANRTGVAERVPAPSVRKTGAVDLQLISAYDEPLRELELYIVTTATPYDVHTFYRLRPISGVGKMLALVLLYEIHDINRCPRVQAFVSSARLGTCPREAAGPRYGTSGTKIGNAYLKWAFSEASVLFLRDNPAGQQYLARLEKHHGKGKALTILAHKLARAVYYISGYAAPRNGSRAGSPSVSPLKLRRRLSG